MSCVRFGPSCARTSAFQALKLSSRPSLATPPSIQQSHASSDAPDAFSALSTPASLERSLRRAPRPARPLAARGIICSTTTARAIRHRRALPFLPCARARHHAGTNTDPTALPGTRAARDAGVPRRPRRLVAFPHTVTLQHGTAVAACACRTPQHHLHHPPARAMVVPHRRRRFYHLLPRQVRPSASPASTTLPDPHARRALACTTPRVRSTCSSRSPSPAPRFSPPCLLPCQRLIILHSKPTPFRHREYGAQHRRSAQQVQRAFLSPAPPSSPLRAPRPSSASTPPSAPNLGLPRIANATCTTPGVSLCGRPHRPVTSPLSTPILSGIAPRSLPTPPYRGPCAARRAAASHRQRRLVWRDDTAAGEQRTNDTEAIRTPRFHCTCLPR
ncbi:hypothetical protein B0H14DRAFT_1449736 [Mycena olivaceomarginata]|nr:hypothetical protein B0H14DRAFT_1449736 [Mycena olivaceomarginata]